MTVQPIGGGSAAVYLTAEDLRERGSFDGPFVHVVEQAALGFGIFFPAFHDGVVDDVVEIKARGSGPELGEFDVEGDFLVEIGSLSGGRSDVAVLA